jgi:uncharacterized protein (DUF488 family)
MAAEAPPFFTIGHSTRSADDFVALLKAAEIQVLVDVRAIPRSRRHPQFNKDSLPGTLQDSQIGYEHMIELGGRRGKQLASEPSPNTFWTNDGFRNYADYAIGADFRDALERLRDLGQRRRSAIMCAEAVWWRCHRRIIADYLLVAGERVFHILGPGHVDPAELSPAAQPRGDGTLVYPADEPAQSSLPFDAP